jgi:hypothetical protein
MADESQRPAPAADMTVVLTISSQPAFFEAAEALTERVGGYAGCPPEDARKLGMAVRRTLGRAFAAGEGQTPPASFDVVYIGNGRVLRVDVACVAAPGGFSLESSVTGTDQAATVRELVDRLEFGREGERQFCRLTRQIRATR